MWQPLLSVAKEQDSSDSILLMLQFFPAWCYALPMTTLDVPLALWEAALWTAIPYFAVGYYKDAARSATPLPPPNALNGQLPHHVSSVHAVIA